MSMWTIERLQSAEDIDSILRVEGESFTNPWTRDMYLAELRNEHSRVYFVRAPERDVIGFGSCWFVADELHINNLAVLPTYRRQGIATALLRHIFEQGRAEGSRRATLEVRRSNESARLLYERFGFIVAGVRRGYYTKPVEDAVVLWREGLHEPVDRS